MPDSNAALIKAGCLNIPLPSSTTVRNQIDKVRPKGWKAGTSRAQIGAALSISCPSVRLSASRELLHEQLPEWLGIEAAQYSQMLAHLSEVVREKGWHAADIWLGRGGPGMVNCLQKAGDGHGDEVVNQHQQYGCKGQDEEQHLEPQQGQQRVEEERKPDQVNPDEELKRLLSIEVDEGQQRQGEQQHEQQQQQQNGEQLRGEEQQQEQHQQQREQQQQQQEEQRQKEQQWQQEQQRQQQQQDSDGILHRIRALAERFPCMCTASKQLQHAERTSLYEAVGLISSQQQPSTSSSVAMLCLSASVFCR